MPNRASRSVTLSVATAERSEMVEVTDRVREVVRRGDVRDGLVVVYVPHTTAGVCINENADPDVKRDVLAKLQLLIAKDESFYRHGEGNSDSHLKTILTGNSVTLLVEDGDVVLGQWQGVYLCDFDGPRTRTVIVKCLDTGRPSLD